MGDSVLNDSVADDHIEHPHQPPTVDAEFSDRMSGNIYLYAPRGRRVCTSHPLLLDTSRETHTFGRTGNSEQHRKDLPTLVRLRHDRWPLSGYDSSQPFRALALDFAGPVQIMDPNATIGSLFIGYTVSLCLYGVTLSQIVLFFRNHRQKSKSLKAIVWVVCIFENAQVVAISQGIWLYLVAFHMNPLALAYPARSFGVLVYLTSMNNLFVRCQRAPDILAANSAIPQQVALSTTVATLAIVYGTQGVERKPWSEGHRFAPIFYAGYSCELAADLIITASIVYNFSQRSVRQACSISSRHDYSNSSYVPCRATRSDDGVAQKLLAYVLNSGLLDLRDMQHHRVRSHPQFSRLPRVLSRAWQMSVVSRSTHPLSF
ncbi:hypothetical protein NUW54_g7885 [Trametes sanguinea]|uniref:Uncharacterized protein n=1 Tax=Trametes sanguinea TaxID=158606 RepID=A0ACC1PIE9_9APHY|nr:hypothetical protein NUW54_g7885 [Trametes sanguinea]